MKKLWFTILFTLLALPVSAQQYLGDYTEDYADLNCKFVTTSAAGVPSTWTGAPVAASVYASDSTTTEVTTGVTATADHDSVTGLNNINVDLSSAAFYAVAQDYAIVVTTGTVDGDSIVGYVPCTFSIENRTAMQALQPTTAGRTLDVATTGEAGIDLDNFAGNLPSTAYDSSYYAAVNSEVLAALGMTGLTKLVAVNTTIATLATQTSFTLTDGSPDDNAYNTFIGIVSDATTAHQKAGIAISDWTASSKTLELQADPGIFTMAVGDMVTIFSIPSTAAGAPTAAAVADAVWDELATGHTDAGKAGEQLWTDIDAVLVDTAEIGAAGAGLTEAGGTGDQYTAIPWNAAWDAEVESEVSDALVAVNLDHVAGTAAPGIAPAGTYLDILADDGTATYDRTTDSLQALRDRGDAAWVTGAGTGLTPLASGTAQGGTASTIQLAAGETFADTEPAGNVVKTVGGTGAGQSRLILTYTGATDTAGIAPDWTTTPDATTLYEIVEGAHVWAVLSRTLTALDEDDTTIDLNGTTVGTVTTLTGHTPQTGDSFARLGAPAGASVSADLAAIEAQTDDIGAAGAGLTALLNIDNYTGTWDAAQFGANALVAATFATDYFTAVADRNWDEILESEGSYTGQQIMSVLLAFAAGNNSVDATVFRDPAGTATRIDYTITGGKRVTVVVTPSSDP
jgi:hypothetical protein